MLNLVVPCSRQYLFMRGNTVINTKMDGSHPRIIVPTGNFHPQQSWLSLLSRCARLRAGQRQTKRTLRVAQAVHADALQAPTEVFARADLAAVLNFGRALRPSAVPL